MNLEFGFGTIQARNLVGSKLLCNLLQIRMLIAFAAYGMMSADFTGKLV